MEDELSRRDFLKCSMAAGALLMAGDTIAGGSMSHAKALMTEVDKLAVWVLTDNYYDALRPDNKITKRYRVVPGKSIHAEHGLSYYVETTIEGKTNACMFDYGLDPVGVMNNMSLLGVDVAKANAFTLSHGHLIITWQRSRC